MMMSRRPWPRTLVRRILALLTLAPALAAADLYQCGSGPGGPVVWRNQPCRSGETQMSREADPPATKKTQTNVQTDTKPAADTGGAIDYSHPAVQQALGGVNAALAADPQLMQRVLQLQGDPDVRAVLNDPDLMRRIQAGQDLKTLSADPRVQRLMHHPMVNELMQRGGVQVPR
ncbi:MAG: hypothetical protein HQL82_07685 [Magnetococcales bacterium]|nr:hypothetical protein [Magnetococcales bacterium]